MMLQQEPKVLGHGLYKSEKEGNFQQTVREGTSTGVFSSTKHVSNRVKSATTGYGSKSRRQPNIRLGSGSGPSSNIFSVKNGKLILTNK